MSWTNPAAHIFATSEVVTASTMNTYIQANLTFLGIGFGAQMSQTTVQSIPNATETVVKFDTIIYDPNGMCTTGVAAMITIPANAGGVYIVNWSVGINAGYAGVVVAYLRHNASQYAQARAASTASAAVAADGATLITLVPTDTIQVTVLQNAGAAENTLVGAPTTVTFSCHLVSPN